MLSLRGAFDVAGMGEIDQGEVDRLYKIVLRQRSAMNKTRQEVASWGYRMAASKTAKGRAKDARSRANAQARLAANIDEYNTALQTWKDAKADLATSQAAAPPADGGGGGDEAPPADGGGGDEGGTDGLMGGFGSW